MATRPTTRSYAGRQVDLELMSHVEDMLPSQKVDPDVHSLPRIVAGIEKAVQRHAKLFLTRMGTMRMEPGRGGRVLSEIRAGRVSDLGVLTALCGAANAEALDLVRRDDADESFGFIPDDERLSMVSVSDVSLDRSKGRVHVRLEYSSVAGDSYEFVIPVPTT